MQDEDKLAAYKDNITQALVNDIYEALHEDTARYGFAFMDDVLSNLISSFVCDIVIRSLQDTDVKSYDEPGTHYTRIKYILQDAMASGFSAAFFVQDRKNPKEFYCQINNIRHFVNSAIN